MKTYIDTKAPGAGNEGVAWTSICHGPRPFLWIQFETMRETSRWQSVERARPFVVQLVGKSGSWTELGSRKTLAGAMDLARLYGQEVAA
jgi:hypothetical protein